MDCRKDAKRSRRIAVDLDRKSDPGIYTTASSQTRVAEIILLFCGDVICRVDVRRKNKLIQNP